MKSFKQNCISENNLDWIVLLLIDLSVILQVMNRSPSTFPNPIAVKKLQNNKKWIRPVSVLFTSLSRTYVFLKFTQSTLLTILMWLIQSCSTSYLSKTETHSPSGNRVAQEISGK